VPALSLSLLPLSIRHMELAALTADGELKSSSALGLQTSLVLHAQVLGSRSALALTNLLQTSPVLCHQVLGSRNALAVENEHTKHPRRPRQRPRLGPSTLDMRLVLQIAAGGEKRCGAQVPKRLSIPQDLVIYRTRWGILPLHT